MLSRIESLELAIARIDHLCTKGLGPLATRMDWVEAEVESWNPWRDVEQGFHAVEEPSDIQPSSFARLPGLPDTRRQEGAAMVPGPPAGTRQPDMFSMVSE